MSSTSLPMRIVIADDHDLIRTGIKALLSRIAGAAVVGEAQDGQVLVDLVESLRPDVVLTDIGMPVLDGISAIALIRARHPDIRLIVLSMHDDLNMVRQAVAKGANGYMMKDAPAFELEHALRTVMASGSYYSPTITRRLLDPAQAESEDELTERQLEVLALIARGLASKEIAYQLGLSPKTVDMHRSRIMARLGLSDVPSLTRYAVRRGLVEL